jgi:hypothetical protein
MHHPLWKSYLDIFNESRFKIKKKRGYFKWPDRMTGIGEDQHKVKKQMNNG